MTHWGTRMSRRVGALLAATTAVLLGTIAPESTAYAAGTPQHEPGLYLSVGQPTQLNRGQTEPGGALTLLPVGVPSSTAYNALAAHIPTSSLYAVGNDQNGTLFRVLSDGTLEPVMQLGTPSSAAAFGEGALADRMYYVQRNSQRLAWVDVVTQQRGAVQGSDRFEPIDMAWNSGYFWGLKGRGDQAKITRMSLDGDVVTAAIPPLDTAKLGSGDFGAAWTYANGNLGFVSNGGGSVQLRVVNADPIEVKIVGYASGPTSNQLDAAMIPAPPGDVAVGLSIGWAGPGTSVSVYVVVTNQGSTPVSGYQVSFGPEVADGRVVESASECVVDRTTFQCGGGPLLPGEERTHSFIVQTVAGGSGFSPRWNASVELNEVDVDPTNNSVSMPLPFSTSANVSTDVKARVIDTNGDGKASPGEEIEVFVLVTNSGPHTLSDVEVHLDTTFQDTQKIEGTIAPGERRTVRFPHVVPKHEADVTLGIASSLSARVSGVPITTASNALLVVGEHATPNPGGLEGEQPSSLGERDPLAYPPWLQPRPPVDVPGADAEAEADADAHGQATGATGAADASGSSGSAGTAPPQHAAAAANSTGAGEAAQSSAASSGESHSADPAEEGGQKETESAVTGSAAGAHTGGSSTPEAAASAVSSTPTQATNASAAELSSTGGSGAVALWGVVGGCLVLGAGLAAAGLRRKRR